MVRPQTSARKRKEYQPKHFVKELVPEESPWTELDWWNERSGICRPIVSEIRDLLKSAVQVLTHNDHKTRSKTPKSPQSVIPASSKEQQDDDDNDSFLGMDRGHLQLFQGSWVVFHPSWGSLSQGTGPWITKTSNNDESKALTPEQEQFLIQKPSGLEDASVVASFKNSTDSNNNNNHNDNIDKKEQVPLPLAQHHLKIPELQCLFVQARTVALSRKGSSIKTLKIQMPNGLMVDFFPILQVIVDDEHGVVYVQDVVEILDALCSYAATVEFQAPTWTAQHETCGDVEAFFAGWLESNQQTAQSFVRLCLQEAEPLEEASLRTAAREIGVGMTLRKRARRQLPTRNTPSSK